MSSATNSGFTSHSLLIRVKDHDDSEAWRALWNLYEPLIRRWSLHGLRQEADADDLVQEVMRALIRELPRFQHNGRTGAFRHWLKQIVINRLREHWRDHQARPEQSVESDCLTRLAELEDPHSSLSQIWNREHDQHVLHQVLDAIRNEFQPKTWSAFELTAQEGRPVSEVATQLEMTPAAVLMAKSRVLKRLRNYAGDLLDSDERHQDQ